MSISFLWLSFFSCTLAIFLSGTKLSRYGDIIAEKTGMGRVWIGVILLAFVTSLPELVTGLSSVLIFQTPDIATGDVLGSCVFNILILASLDVFDRASPISSRVQQRHVLSAGFGILLLALVAGSVFLSESRYAMAIGLGWVGLYTPIIIILYLISMRMIFFHEKKVLAAFVKERVEELQYEKIPKRKVYVNFTVNAVIVVVAATFLPEIGKRLAEITGLGQTFIGTILIAVSTSLPEIVVSVTALRIGAGDMAIGNLFGSNLFNIGILALDDVLFFRGPLLSFVQPAHIVSALTALIMMIISVIGLTYRASRKRLILGWDALSIIVVYVLNILILYRIK